MKEYDIVTIGGGLGGAALAGAMAERGARVLVVERETRFKDRVRGEGMAPWGADEAQRLGIYDLLISACTTELRWWDLYMGTTQVEHRDLPATTPAGTPALSFYHPDMQETLLAAAEGAGAEVWRGAQVKGVQPGAPPRVTIRANGGSKDEVKTRLVVGADGRTSVARRLGEFQERRDPDRLLLTGVLLDGLAGQDEDSVRLVMSPPIGRAAILFPQGGGRVRSYVAMGADQGIRLQGDRDVPRFFQESVSIGIPGELYEGVTATGPLATFDGAASWVDHPYKDGVALIGDAAATTDPCWGQGLSMTLRDVRVLRDALIANDDWNAGAHAYAEAHDRAFETIHTVEGWLTEFFYETGPEADAVRERALPLHMEDPSRQPDHTVSGPDAPAGEHERRRFFGEE